MEMNNPDPKTMTPYEAFLHARDVVGGRWEPGEAVIAAAGWASCQYARLLGRSFPPGEAAIARNAAAALDYARLIGERFLLGEAVIATDPNMADWYKKLVVGPFPEAAATPTEPRA